ncbi:hypothetical protein Q7P37_005935 [Cladosporium fusiforme]
MRSNFAAILAISVPFASAGVFDSPLGALGLGQPGPSSFEETNLDSLSGPNATNSVNFTFVGEEWTWRVNVSEITSHEDESSNNSSKSVAMTTFDLRWPNSTSSLNETVRALNTNDTSGSITHSSTGNSSKDEPLCMAVLTRQIYPNVTNLHGEADNGDCEIVLGKECVEEILSDVEASGDCSPLSFAEYKACQNHLPPFTGASSLGDSISDLNNQTYPGDSIFWQTGPSSNGSNSTALLAAKSRFQMMVLSHRDAQKALCMRVDPSIDDEEVSDISSRPDWRESNPEAQGHEPDDSTSDDEDDESGAASQFAVATGAIVLCGMITAMVQLM